MKLDLTKAQENIQKLLDEATNSEQLNDALQAAVKLGDIERICAYSPKHNIVKGK